MALVRTEVSGELNASFIRVTRYGEVGTRLSVTKTDAHCKEIPTLMKEALSSSETSVLARATRRNIPEDAILHSHRREKLKSYNFHLVPTPRMPGSKFPLPYTPSWRSV
jgi:hypothetical protein